VAGVVTAMNLYVGVMAEQVVYDADRVARVPDEVTWEQAAAAGLAAVTAYDLVQTLQLTPDDSLLVAGATGGVGTIALQLAAVTGATVIATGRRDADDALRKLGATDVVDYTADLDAEIARAAPDGVRAVAHAAGDAAALARALRPGGRLASILGATPEQVGRDDITVTGVGGVDTPEKIRALLDAIARDELRVPIADTFHMDRAADAVAAFGHHKLGKLVVTMT
jgi:NADPH:quinone reductase-like Zn-dependent oxidoreductase